jgi:hypothetical protein
MEVAWVLACNSGDVVETLRKEYPNESPLICCVAHHSWMNAALLATQSQGGVTIGLEPESNVTVGYELAGTDGFARFLTDLVRQLGNQVTRASS